MVQTELQMDLVKEEKPDIIANNLAYKEELKRLPEVQNLTNQIKINEPMSILKFGEKPSLEISKISDDLIRTTTATSIENARDLLNNLSKIMSRFEIKDFDVNKKPGLIERVFGKTKSKLEEMMSKYSNMSKELENVGLSLKMFEEDLKDSNKTLSMLYQNNIRHYQELEKYIVAGEIAKQEIIDYSNEYSKRTDIGDQEKNAELFKFSKMIEMLDQRVLDLQVAENVSMQACPMIHAMQMSNFNLARKINSSFIITLPTFKNSLLQAIELQKQEIISKSLMELDRQTNEQLIKNANNTVQHAINTTREANQSSIKMETLRESYNIIKNGLNEIDNVARNSSEQRQRDKSDLERMKSDLKSLNNGNNTID